MSTTLCHGKLYKIKHEGILVYYTVKRIPNSIILRKGTNLIFLFMEEFPNTQTEIFKKDSKYQQYFFQYLTDIVTFTLYPREFTISNYFELSYYNE
jgi:hypothetical protein